MNDSILLMMIQKRREDWLNAGINKNLRNSIALRGCLLFGLDPGASDNTQLGMARAYLERRAIASPDSDCELDTCEISKPLTTAKSLLRKMVNAYEIMWHRTGGQSDPVLGEVRAWLGSPYTPSVLSVDDAGEQFVTRREK